MVKLWEKFQFWKKKMPKLNEDYILVTVNSENDPDFPETLAVELLVDKYKNVLYYYENAKVQEIDDNAILSFNYCILNYGEHTHEELKEDHEFKTLLGDILVEITTVERDNEQTRNDNTEEPDLH